MIWCQSHYKLYTRRIADESDSDLSYSEVPLKGKNQTLVKILGGRQHRTTPAGQILGVATPATPAALTPMDLDQLSYMAGHVINTAKKLEDPMPIRS